MINSGLERDHSIISLLKPGVELQQISQGWAETLHAVPARRLLPGPQKPAGTLQDRTASCPQLAACPIIIHIYRRHPLQKNTEERGNHLSDRIN